MNLKYYSIFLLCCIFIVYFLFLIYSQKNSIENFSLNLDNTVSLEKFNELFNTDIVELPKNLLSIGIDNNTCYFYNNDNIKSTGFKWFVNYWYNEIHPHVNCKKYYFIYCHHDGYRERIPYCDKLIPFIPEKKQFLNKQEIADIDKCSSPILHKNKYIFVNSKIVSDDTAICVPDIHYILNHGYEKTLLKTVDENYINFDDKKSICVYRGNINNGSVYNFKDYENKNNMNQRSYLKSIKDRINNFDYSDDFKSIEEQIKFKYILDVDGWSNTWDATVWKLYSGSVLLKTTSVWKQWYYDDLKKWVHYVPVENDFSDLNEKIEWCRNNNEKCKEIIKNSRKLVIEKLNWDKTKNDTIDIFKKYTKEYFP